MKARKPLAILGVAAVVVGLVIAGTAFAQTPTPTQTPGQQNRANYQNFFLDRVASILGVSRDALNSALTQARNDTADQAVKDGKLTQDQANNLKSRTGNNGFGFGFGFGHPGRGEARPKGKFDGADVMNAVAQALGMTPQDLMSQLRSGKTLADLAKGKEQAVKDAIVNAEKPKLDQAVQSGKMTQDQENKILDNIRNADLSKIGPHWGFGWGKGHGQNPAPGNRPSMGPAMSGASSL